METEVLFKEKQHFRQWWLWLILILINGLQVWFLIEKYLYKKSFPDTAYHGYKSAEIAALITFLVTVLVWLTELETVIESTQIRVRFLPFHFSFRHYRTAAIDLAYVRLYNPLIEYGGWGIRFGLTGKGKAFNVSGNQGIQLVFKDGRKLLIGTQKPDEAAAALQHFLQKKA